MNGRQQLAYEHFKRGEEDLAELVLRESTKGFTLETLLHITQDKRCILWWEAVITFPNENGIAWELRWIPKYMLHAGAQHALEMFRGVGSDPKQVLFEPRYSGIVARRSLSPAEVSGLKDSPEAASANGSRPEADQQPQSTVKPVGSADEPNGSKSAAVPGE